MKVLGFVILCVLIAGVLSVPQKEKTGKQSPLAITCLDGRFEVGAWVYEALTPCNDDEKFPEERKACQFFCQAKILNLLDDQGLPDKQKYYKLAQHSAQLGYESKAFRHFSSCFQYAQNIDTTEESCLSVKQFADCTWKIAGLQC